MSHPIHPSLGADLRAVRRTRGMTLEALAHELGRSVGWLSQVERDLSRPSGEDLADLARALDVQPAILRRATAAPAAEAGRVVRSEGRRPIGHRQQGLVEELLSPDLTDDFEVIHSTFAPGAAITTPVSRPTQEVGFLVSGRLDLQIADDLHHLETGDSFRLRGEPYLWSNPHDQPAVAVWIISPPVY